MGERDKVGTDRPHYCSACGQDFDAEDDVIGVGRERDHYREALEEAMVYLRIQAPLAAQRIDRTLLLVSNDKVLADELQDPDFRAAWEADWLAHSLERERRYREALERIRDWPCDQNDTGELAECPELDCDPCPSCLARQALRGDEDG